jgi:signal transduction histidine kinase
LWRGLLPFAWLTVGLVVAFGYSEGFSGLFSMTLPLPLFLGQAIILSTLLLTQKRHWWAYLTVYYVLLVAEGVLGGRHLSLVYAFSSNVANVVEPLLGALLVRHFVSRPQPFSQLRDTCTYFACVALGSVAGATIGATARIERGFAFWQSWPGWFLSDVLASLVVAPVIVLWVTSGPRDWRSIPRARLVEAALLSLALVALGVFVFASRPDNPDMAPALLYLTVPPLAWAAVRFGPLGLMTSLTAVTTMAIAGAANDLGPFQGRSVPADVLTLQLLLLGVGMPLLLLSVLTLERQQAQLRLFQSEQRYQVMVGSLPRDAVLLFGSDLKHEFADGQALQSIGLSKDGVEGKTLADSFPHEIAVALEPRYRAALAGQHATFELTHAGRQFQMDALSVSDAEGPTGMLVMHDVTDQKRAEFLAELDRTKTSFFSNVSHELRTPLTLVLGPLQNARASGVLAGGMLRLVYRNALRLQRLVDALLDLSRLEAGRMTASFVRTDVAALTQDLASNFRPVVESAGLRLIVQTPPLPPDLPVSVDRDMYEKVVLNLISNAFNHTFEGEIGVSVDATPERNAFELKVWDTGIGIDAEDQAHIFDRFHRVQGARSRSQEGSGIGLALVHELVRLHGGCITVESAPQRGSTFTVRLPVGLPDLSGETPRSPVSSSARVAAFVEDASTWVPEPETPAQQQHGNGVTSLGRIVVADDNPDMRRYIAEILSDRWTILSAADGQAALRMIQNERPELVLLDVMMPMMNGFEVLAAVRSDARTRRIPVIMLSARAGEDAAIEGLEAGANDYVTKPFAAGELSARVRTQVEARYARDQAEAAHQARDEFVAVVVHDLRHPLAALNWHLQILQRLLRQGESVTSEQLAQFMQALEASVRSMSSQIDELRDATHLQSGRSLDLDLQRTDLVELAQAVVQRHEDGSELNQVRLEVEVATLIGDWDAERLERVIANLLSNAVKYSPADSEITLRVGRDNGWGVLSVDDHGMGIPAADLPHIFERYRRGANVAGRVRGSGLGLAGARDIVAQHGGTITVQSVEGHGSTFVIRLPLSRDKQNSE